MNVSPESDQSRPCWFVRVSLNPESDDPTTEILYEGEHTDDIKSIKPGDRIALKRTFLRKHGLPFENRGRLVSTMAIEAIGKVIANPGDGRHLVVELTRFDPPREWYFYTTIRTVWRVQPGGRWGNDELIGFTFEGQRQNIDYFRNQPFWRGRYGDEANEDDPRFKWTRFYETIADKLLQYSSNRVPLVQAIHAIARSGLKLPNFEDRLEDGKTEPLTDICPFTTIGIFNRQISDDKRKAIARELADFLGVDVPVPDSFEGIPVLDNRNTWFFAFSKDREPGDIGFLWNVFASAIALAKAGDDVDVRSRFARAYDAARQVRMVKWNLSMGLYWVRPWHFQNLDGRSRPYISHDLGIPVSGPPSAKEYLELLDSLSERFQTEECPVRSCPELSLAAWNKAIGLDPPEPPPKPTNGQEVVPPILKTDTTAVEPYSIENILKDGCFLERDTIKAIIGRLRSKKNLILQGPPGTGKTWLAKRLAFALINQRDGSKVRSLQFHPNLSYEDFVRGLRPAPDGNGRLELVDGPFIKMINDAKADPNAAYVLVIEEINRGQPAQIFGEMLTLLEADKRNSDSALELTYQQPGETGVYIPDNLYVIGTMNIADRSLALVDFAFRRRFAFVDLEPILDERWSGWVNEHFAIDPEALATIAEKLNALNDAISDDPGLGPQFRVGHSFVTPPAGSQISDVQEWFRQVTQTEIGPLLEEYWFDNREQAASQLKRLLEGI